MNKSKLRAIISQILSEETQKSQVQKNREHVHKIYMQDKKAFDARAALYPEMFIDEVGIDVVLDYLKAEDGTNFFFDTPHGERALNYKKELDPSKTEIPDLKYKAKIMNNLPQIKSRLLHYFSRRMFANISHEEDWTNWTSEDLKKWMEVYKERFMYEYLLPYSKLAD